jgi:hypothetical protein
VKSLSLSDYTTWREGVEPTIKDGTLLSLSNAGTNWDKKIIKET